MKRTPHHIVRMHVTHEQLERYNRQILLKDVGIEGQRKLLQAKVMIIGAGGLGSPAALYLGAAGVGTIGIADHDAVERSNLQRQILHSTMDLHKPKVLSAQDSLQAINPDVKVKTYQTLVNSENILDIIQDYDFVIDCSDNFSTKFLLNDACVIATTPFSHGGIQRFSGQTMTVIPHESACYRCVFPEPPPPGVASNPAQEGVLGVLPGIIGALQAAEALKFILGIGELLTDRLLMCELLTLEFRTVKLLKNPDCPVCGENPRITNFVEEAQGVCPSS